MDMTPRANAALVERMYAALAGRDLARVRSSFSPDYRHRSDGRELTFDEVIQTAMLAPTAFPDLSSRVLETIAEDERVMIRMEYQGTHTGEVPGVPPTGRSISWTTLNVFVVRDGLIVEDRPYWDMGVIFRQLDVDPAVLGL